MVRITGGEALVRAVVGHGVEVLFVLPGVQNDPFFSALYDAAETLKVIVTRHEQAAAYMAHGYAAASGRVGAYRVVPGPGFLNTTAALATSYACNLPVLCLSGQIPSARDRPRRRPAARDPRPARHHAAPDPMGGAHRGAEDAGRRWPRLRETAPAGRARSRSDAMDVMAREAWVEAGRRGAAARGEPC